MLIYSSVFYVLRCAGLLDVFETESAVVQLGRRVAALVGVSVHVDRERLHITCKKKAKLREFLAARRIIVLQSIVCFQHFASCYSINLDTDMIYP